MLSCFYCRNNDIEAGRYWVCTIKSSWKIPFLVPNRIKFQKHFLESHHESWIQLRESETDKKSKPKGCNHRWENSNFARGKKPSIMQQLELLLQADLRPRVLILSSEPLLLKSSNSKSRRQRPGLNRWLWNVSLREPLSRVPTVYCVTYGTSIFILSSWPHRLLLLKANSLPSLCFSSSVFWLYTSSSLFIQYL